jgi:ferritin-like metal-binding protein YciE
MPGKTKTLHDAFVHELRDMYNAERQIARALPKMAKAACSSQLRTAFEDHLAETEGHIDRLDRAFADLAVTTRGVHCEGIAGILEEGKEVLGDGFDDSALDAAIIAAAQRVEHYEIAVYGTLIEWAKAMGHGTVEELLRQNLEEEKAADKRLTKIAAAGINDTAARIAHPRAESAAR